MKILQIDSQGQVAIPSEIQEKLGLLPGTEVQIEVVGNTLQLRKTGASRGSLLIETIRGKATAQLSTDEIMQITRDRE